MKLLNNRDQFYNFYKIRKKFFKFYRTMWHGIDTQRRGIKDICSYGRVVDAHKAETRRKEVVWASSVVINLNQANAFEGLHWLSWRYRHAGNMLRFIREKEIGDCNVGERDERKAKVGCTDMFTREGNIPHTNRNGKPTAAARQPPAASFREPCTHKQWDRESRVEGWGWRLQKPWREGSRTRGDRLKSLPAPSHSLLLPPKAPRITALDAAKGARWFRFTNSIISEIVLSFHASRFT